MQNFAACSDIAVLAVQPCRLDLTQLGETLPEAFMVLNASKPEAHCITECSTCQQFCHVLPDCSVVFINNLTEYVQLSLHSLTLLELYVNG